MNLSGWKSASEAVARRVVAGEAGQPADVADEHPRPLDVVERPVEGARDAGLDEALAQADAQVAAEHLDDVLGGHRVGAFEQAAQDRRLPGRAGGRLDLGERGGHLGERRARLGRRGVAGRAQHLGDGDARGPTSGRRPRPARRVGRARSRSRWSRSRTSRDPPRAGRPRRTAGRSGRPRRPAAPRESGCAGSRRRGRSSRTFEWSPRGARPARSSDACGGWYTVPRMVQRAVVPGGADRLSGRAAPARPGQHRRVPALVRRPRDRAAGALPGDADATRGDRALLRRPGRRPRRAVDGRPREGDRPPGRHVRVQPARRRERLGALPHHHRRVRCVGQGLRHRGDAADARPRVRDARPAPHRAVRLRVQRAGHPRLQALRLRRRGSIARVDLARRPVVGRDGDERPRVGLAGAAGRDGPSRPRPRPTPRRPTSTKPSRSRSDRRIERVASFGRWR